MRARFTPLLQGSLSAAPLSISHTKTTLRQRRRTHACARPDAHTHVTHYCQHGLSCRSRGFHLAQNCSPTSFTRRTASDLPSHWPRRVARTPSMRPRWRHQSPGRLDSSTLEKSMHAIGAYHCGPCGPPILTIAPRAPPFPTHSPLRGRPCGRRLAGAAPGACTRLAPAALCALPNPFTAPLPPGASTCWRCHLAHSGTASRRPLALPLALPAGGCWRCQLAWHAAIAACLLTELPAARGTRASAGLQSSPCLPACCCLLACSVIWTC